MKILVVCQFYYPENFVIYKICEQLAAFGHDVTVLTGKPNYGYGYILPEYKNVKTQYINGVNVERVNLIARKQGRLSIILNYLSFWINSKRWVRRTKEKFDVVYSMSLSPVTILSAGNLYKEKHNVKHIVHCVDLWPESVLITNAVRKNSLMYEILYKWSKKLYSNVDEVLLGSPSFEEYFSSVLELKELEKKIIVQPSLVEKCELPAFEFDKDYLNITYCGNLGTIQNIDLMVEAMREIKGSKIRMNVIGMGPMSNYLTKKIEEYGLQDNIIYFGPIPAKQAAAYLKGSDYLYVSLKDEGYVGKTIPNKLVMYMALQKPIIAMLGGDGRELLKESDGAILVDQNSKALKEALINAEKIPLSARDKMATNNLTYFKNNLTIEKITRDIEKELLRKAR